MTPSNRLEALRQWTTVVADTGDIDEIARLKPTEATTNPSLILKAARTTRGEAILAAAQCANESPRLRIDRVVTDFGKAILEHIPGRVSTEVDARLSFDTRATIEKRGVSLRFTKRAASPASASSSKLPRPGKAAKRPECSNRKAFTAT